MLLSLLAQARGDRMTARTLVSEALAKAPADPELAELKRTLENN